jgi:hypothetical protein
VRRNLNAKASPSRPKTGEQTSAIQSNGAWDQVSRAAKLAIAASTIAWLTAVAILAGTYMGEPVQLPLIS